MGRRAVVAVGAAVPADRDAEATAVGLSLRAGAGTGDAQLSTQADVAAGAAVGTIGLQVPAVTTAVGGPGGADAFSAAALLPRRARFITTTTVHGVRIGVRACLATASSIRACALVITCTAMFGIVEALAVEAA